MNNFQLGYKINSVSSAAYTTDGFSQRIIGTIDIPVTCDNLTKKINFLIIPSFY